MNVKMHAPRAFVNFGSVGFALIRSYDYFIQFELTANGKGRGG